jgi:hypothetical protein
LAATKYILLTRCFIPKVHDSFTDDRSRLYSTPDINFSKKVPIMIVNDGFPKEHFIEINNQPFFIGRITIHKMKEKFNSEVDIVQSETRKIYHHVSMIYDRDEYEDILDMSMSALSKFLKTGKKL